MKITPTVGRIVHVTHGGGANAAIIVRVHADMSTCDLFVMPRDVAGGPPCGRVDRVSFSPVPQPDCWSWPPRRDDAPRIITR